MSEIYLEEKRYSYNKFRKGLLLLLFLWFMYGFVMIFYALFDMLRIAVQASLNQEPEMAFGFFGMTCFLLIPFIPFYSLFPIFTGIALSDVRTTEEGLYVQVFFFWWVFVPWKNILETRTRFKKSILRRKETTVVLVRSLTPFHRLIGVTVGRLKPGFQIESSISGYAELIDLIQKKIEQRSTYS